MLQIIHLALGKANPERMNGVNKVVHYLALAQSANGLNVSVWGITKEYKEHNYPPRNFKTRLFPRIRNRFGVSKQLKSALKELPEGTIVHMHGGFIPEFYGVSKCIYRLQKKLRLVLTSHGAYNLVALQRSYWRKRIFYWVFERHSLKRLSLVHLLGPSEVSGFTKFTQLLEVPLVCIPNGQVLNGMHLNIKKIPNDVFKISFCGRMDLHTKGLDIMLKAFKMFLTEMPSQATFTIIGDGQDIDKVKQLAKELALNGNVIFSGSKFGEEKDELIKSTHFFLHTSRNEGVPMAVLEAASMRVPVIISKETNLESYVRSYQAGWCLNQNSEEELLQVLKDAHRTMQHEPSYSAMQENSYRMIEEALNWNSLAKKWKEEYERLD